MFTVRLFPAPELGNTSFLVADPEAGVAAVIDPYRDIDGYLTHAEKHNMRVTRALDTHVHNDFVSGGRELAAEAGADIGDLPAGSEVDLGALKIRALHTPGHTPDHKSYLLLDGDRPRVLFSGGAIMVGSIARTDLFGPHLAMHLAIEALSTLQVRLRGLPDDIAVYPTHGGGSFCGIGDSQGSETTLGRERATNPFFLATEVMPFLARALDQHRYPDYYRDMGALNHQGMPLLGRKPAAPAKLSPEQVGGLMSNGAAVVDIRPGIEYDRGHIPGSYCIGLEGGSFSAWAGWLIARDRGIVLAGGSDAEHVEAQRQLYRIGFDRVMGALDGGMDAWAASGRELSTFETADIEDLGTWIISGEVMTVLDARDDHEWADGHVPGAVHMYVPDIPHHAAEIPADAPVAVHCGVGYRAGIAASLLEQAGLKRIIHVNAPYEDWAGRLHLAETVPH
ncbi:MAG TPA: MBL fold metallo-hydrolase [Candidatus Dormibacteraeota bacterium]|jgi:hydroxyacylglutathione hydrolase